jgi:hypothetical protein
MEHTGTVAALATFPPPLHVPCFQNKRNWLSGEPSMNLRAFT